MMYKPDFDIIDDWEPDFSIADGSKYDFNFANDNWKIPGFLETILPKDGSIPEWLVEVRASRTAIQHPKSATALRRNIQPRRANDKNWIKKNHYTGGIRQRPLEARAPRGMTRPLNLAQYQRHSIQLMSKVLNLRTNASPFTLILDDLNQRAQPLLEEFVRRGLSRKVNVVVVSFESARRHPAIRDVPAYGDQTGDEILQEIEKAMRDCKESLVIVDSLYDLNNKGVNMGVLLHLVAMKYASTLVGVCHQDMLDSPTPENVYAPQSLDVLNFMATTVITTKSLAHVLATKAAKERSLPEPTHGLLQGAEGVVQCLRANDHRGIVLETEFRRKSGRPESEVYFLRNAQYGDFHEPLGSEPVGTLKKEFVILLEQLPAYSNKNIIGLVNAAGNDFESTFNLGLTDKQKMAREGVVLPYFDAQNPEGGEGGRILYDMGSEDDFDEEEDEI